MTHRVEYKRTGPARWLVLEINDKDRTIRQQELRTVHEDKARLEAEQWRKAAGLPLAATGRLAPEED